MEKGGTMPNVDNKKNKPPCIKQDMTATKEKFNKHIINENAIATNNIRAEKFDLDKAKQKSSPLM
ncbi:MAG: hypothetical protein CK424_04365 [Legionella sp.]|nr:MAG: hypothetical protein CK424_04365 [Legionella sp.]